MAETSEADVLVSRVQSALKVIVVQLVHDVDRMPDFEPQLKSIYESLQRLQNMIDRARGSVEGNDEHANLANADAVRQTLDRIYSQYPTLFSDRANHS